MYKFEVIVRGPNAFEEAGFYRTYLLDNVSEVSDQLVRDLKDDGYIRLYRTHDDCATIFKESITSFSVKLIKEHEE